MVRNGGNQQQVALVFPLSKGTVWDSNILNAEQEEEYRLQLLPVYRLGDADYPNATKVVHHEEDDLVMLRDFRHEIFVKGVGLIETYDEVLSYCSRHDCPGKPIIEAGRLTHLTLIQYG